MGALLKVAGSTREPIAGWNEPATLTLDEFGRIYNCNKSAEELFGFSSYELLDQDLSLLLPELSGKEVVKDGEPNQQVTYLSRIGHLFRAKDHLGNSFFSELSFVVMDDDTRWQSVHVIVQPCQDQEPERYY